MSLFNDHETSQHLVKATSVPALNMLLRIPTFLHRANHSDQSVRDDTNQGLVRSRLIYQKLQSRDYRAELEHRYYQCYIDTCI